MKPEFWVDETNGIVRQVNGLTTVEYHFSTIAETKKAKTIMYNYVEKWAKKRNRDPLYPEYLVEACLKQGISVLHVRAGRL